MALKERIPGGTLLKRSLVAAYPVTQQEDATGNPKSDKVATVAGEIKFVKWGADNQKPQQMLLLASANHFKPQLLYTERNILYGSGLILYKRNIVDGLVKPEIIENARATQIMEQLDIAHLVRRTLYNTVYSGQAFFHLMPDASGNGLTSLDCIDFNQVRIAPIANGKRKPEEFFIHSNWKNPKKEDITRVTAWDTGNLTDKPAYMVHVKDGIPGQVYYDYAPWWSSETWTSIDNYIAKSILSLLQNGWNVKYVVKYPADHFLKLCENDKDKAEKAENEWLDSLDDFLAGEENVGKTLLFKYSRDPISGKEMPGFSIEPIDNPASADFDKKAALAAIAQTSSHGMDPSLAGIDTGGRLGGSGSEKRISYQLHKAMRTPVPRQLVLDAILRIIKAYYKDWPEGVRIGIEDVDITTIAENPTGNEKVMNPQA